MTTRPRAPLALLLALSTLLAPGCCSTLQALSSDGPAVLGGTRVLAKAFLRELSLPDEDVSASALACLLLLADVPLSLGVDGLLLPYAALNELRRRGIDAEVQLALGGCGCP